MFNSHEAASKSHSFAAAQEWNAAVSTEHAGSEAVSDEMRTHIAYGVSLGIPAKRIAEVLGANPKYVPGGNVEGSLNGTQAGGTSNAEIQRTRPGRGVQAPIVPGTGQIMGGISNAEVNRVGGGPPAR